MVLAKKFIYAHGFKGEPKPTDVKLVEEELPPLKDGEYLAKAEYLSVDPYIRGYMTMYPEGSLMIGAQLAKIIESKNDKFPVGKHVVGSFGWRTHTIVNPAEETASPPGTYLLPDIGNLSPSLGLGVLGMPGNTAYFGLLEICQPKAGETVVVTGAAGAVGMLVGQIARIKGCKVIGFAGSDKKCNWLKNELGFDHAFNYKTVNAKKALEEAAPKGVDCFFDNVGGELSTTIMAQMSNFGRVSVCGFISSYNDDWRTIKTPMLQPLILMHQLKVEGFVVTRWADKWMEGIQQSLKWLNEGKLKNAEHVTEGFENMFDAFVGMLRGENTGKAIVKV